MEISMAAMLARHEFLPRMHAFPVKSFPVQFLRVARVLSELSREYRENMSETAKLWAFMQDIIGTASCWPPSIRLLFWKRNVKHFERLLLCSFVYVNGLPMELFLQWADLKGLFRVHDSRNHFVNLHGLFVDGKYNDKYYAYNETLGRYELLNGCPKYRQ